MLESAVPRFFQVPTYTVFARSFLSSITPLAGTSFLATGGARPIPFPGAPIAWLGAKTLLIASNTGSTTGKMIGPAYGSMTYANSTARRNQAIRGSVRPNIGPKVPVVRYLKNPKYPGALGPVARPNHPQKGTR